MTDEAIVRECQAGDYGNFATLYDAYLKRIYDFIYFKTHHRETAEDLTTQVFMSVLENIDSFEHGKGAFVTWIYRIARNKIVDHYRSFKPLHDIEDAWDISSDSDIERDADTALSLQKIEAAMQSLTAAQREIVLLRLWQDMSFKEIARLTGKNEAAVKMAFGRALEKIRSEDLLLLLALFFFTLR